MMKLIRSIILIACMGLLVSASAALTPIVPDCPSKFPHPEYGSPCNWICITIINKTNSTCQLSGKPISKYGGVSYDENPLQTSNSTKAMAYGEYVYGPELTMTYDCGSGKRITLYMQQGFCSVFAHLLVTGIQNPEKLNATAIITKDAAHGGFFSPQSPGEVTWIITDKAY